MTDELQKINEQIKENISELVGKGKLLQAQELLNQYISMIPDDVEVFSIQAIIYICAGQLTEAQNTIETGLNKDKNNFDLLYNLAYLSELQDEYDKAVSIYLKLTDSVYTGQQQILVKTALERIKSTFPEMEINRKKIVFFSKPGMDTFMKNVMDGLFYQYETKKVIVTDEGKLIEGMQWADVCWFDWCDELVISASKLDIARERKIICRLHSYEAFTNWPEQVNWENVDNFIIDSEHIKNVVLPRIRIDREKISMIPVGINDENFTFKDREKGFNVAFLGSINFKKGPMLLIHLLDALVKKDNRYILHMCGKFQDNKYVLYFDQMIKELKLEKNIKYIEWVESVNDWLEDKDYILSTSLLEGQHISVMEAMCKGMKPIVHNFVGAKGLYKDNYVWNTIDEAVDMVQSEHYISSEYRSFIVDNYSNKQQMKKIKQILKDLKQ